MRQAVQHSLVKALKCVPDFAALDDATLLSIVGASANLVWRAGARIFERGSLSDALYIVLAGRVKILDRVQGREVEVSSVGPGESFGELSLILNTTHTKDAVAEEDTEIMVLPRESFEALLASNPEIAAQFHERAERRRAVDAEGVAAS